MKVKQSIPRELRYSVKDFNNEFPNDSACLDYVAEERFPGGVTHCPKCGEDRKHHRVGNRTAYACDHCGHHAYPLKGTIFEKSSTSLRTWFYAMYLMGSTRCGISAKQIQRETGVTYKTAWRIFRQVRSLLSDGDVQLEGPTVEIDETYIGGRRKGKRGRPMRGDKVKTPVVAIVQRKGKVIAKAVPDAIGASLLPFVRDHVVPGSVIYTDEYAPYEAIPRLKSTDGEPLNYRHKTINHGDGVYVRGDIHTNSVEGFWMLVKTGIRGVYHSVSTKHLQSYLDEYSFRFNRRHMGNQQFRSILERASRKASQPPSSEFRGTGRALAAAFASLPLQRDEACAAFALGASHLRVCRAAHCMSRRWIFSALARFYSERRDGSGARSLFRRKRTYGRHVLRRGLCVCEASSKEAREGMVAAVSGWISHGGLCSR